MSFLIRDAEEADCPALLGLIRELAVYEREPDAVTVSEAHFRESGFGQAPVWRALVAASGSEIVGFALWYVRYSTWKGQRMYLEDLYVQPQSRKHGIGTALMNALIEEAGARGFHGISWQVLDWNEPAISFYRRFQAGFDGGWINCALDF